MEAAIFCFKSQKTQITDNFKKTSARTEALIK